MSVVADCTPATLLWRKRWNLSALMWLHGRFQCWCHWPCSAFIEHLSWHGDAFLALTLLGIVPTLLLTDEVLQLWQVVNNGDVTLWEQALNGDNNSVEWPCWLWYQHRVTQTKTHWHTIQLLCHFCFFTDKALYDQSTEDVDECLTSSSVGHNADSGPASLWGHYRSVYNHLLWHCEWHIVSVW